MKKVTEFYSSKIINFKPWDVNEDRTGDGVKTVRIYMALLSKTASNIPQCTVNRAFNVDVWMEQVHDFEEELPLLNAYDHNYYFYKN